MWFWKLLMRSNIESQNWHCNICLRAWTSRMWFVVLISLWDHFGSLFKFYKYTRLANSLLCLFYLSIILLHTDFRMNFSYFFIEFRRFCFNKYQITWLPLNAKSTMFLLWFKVCSNEHSIRCRELLCISSICRLVWTSKMILQDFVPYFCYVRRREV